jgi:hypothetical protein
LEVIVPVVEAAIETESEDDLDGARLDLDQFIKVERTPGHEMLSYYPTLMRMLTRHLGLVFKGPVRSGFWPQKWATGNRNRLPNRAALKKPDRNRFFQLLALFVVTRKKKYFLQFFYIKPAENYSI